MALAAGAAEATGFRGLSWTGRRAGVDRPGSASLIEGWRERGVRAGQGVPLALVGLVLMGLTPAGMAAAQTPEAGPVSPTRSTFTYVVHHFGRPIGEERDELAQNQAGRTLTTALAYTDRGGRIEFRSSLHLAADLTPLRFEAKGKTYRFVNVDVEVEIQDGRARSRSRDESVTAAVPRVFFTARSYAPLAARALLIEYWEKHGRPRELPLRPDGNIARIRYRGEDDLRVGGRTMRLRRYSVDGVVWGQEAVWVDGQNHLAALLTRIHILPLEAVRDDLVDALPAFQALAVQDRMADLNDLAEAIRPRAQGTFAVIGARLFDGTAGPVVDDSAVLVLEGKIVAAGPRASIPIPTDVPVIDARGKTMVPGLWDMHGHLSQIEWAPAYLAAGVTTARDVGGERSFLTAFRDGLRAPRGLGLRLLLAGLVDGGGPDGYGTTIATTPALGRAIVDAYRAAGFNQMKLYSQLAPDVVRAITGRAHELGMTVTGHIPVALSFREAIESGMDQFEHLAIRGAPGSTEVTDLVHFLAGRGTVAGPTLAWDELLGRDPGTSVASFEPGIAHAPIPLVASYQSVRNDVDAAKARAALRRELDLIMALHEAGIRIVAGTDGALPGKSLLRTLELFVEAGLTPREALASASTVPAKFMGLDKVTGAIEPGQSADFLVTDGDPLVNISNLRRGRWVAAGGKLYECAALWRAAGFTPPD